MKNSSRAIIVSRLVIASVFALAFTALSAGSASAVRYTYWVNGGTDSIMRAEIGGGAPETIVADAGANACSLAIDRAAGRVYWALYDTSGEIRSAKLDGTDGQTLNTGSATVSRTCGLALDPKQNRIWWSNGIPGHELGWAALDGSAAGEYNTAGAPIYRPFGLASDPLTDEMFWSNLDAQATSGYVGGVAYMDIDGLAMGRGGVPPASGMFAGSAFAASPGGGNRAIYAIRYADGTLLKNVLYSTVWNTVDTTGANMTSPEGLGYDAARDEILISDNGGSQIVRVKGDESGSTSFVAPYPSGGAAVSGAGHLTPSAPQLQLTTTVGASVSGTIHLTNDGDYPIAILVDDVDSGDPSIVPTGGCWGRLAIGASCELTVTYTPTSTEPIFDQVEVLTDAGTFRFSVEGTMPVAPGPPAVVNPFVNDVRATTRCASKGNAGQLAVKLTSATATTLGASLQRTSTRRKTLPRKCPRRADRTGYSGRAIGKIRKKIFPARAGAQSANFREIFGVQSLAPGRYRLIMSYDDAAGVVQKRSTSFWVLRP